MCFTKPFSNFLSRIAIALIVTEMHELPTFCATLNTKKLTPSADTSTVIFSLYCYQRHLQNLLVYAKVTRPMQSQGCEILLWLQTGSLTQSYY